MCNEYHQQNDPTQIADAFSQLKIPFSWSVPPAPDRKTHIFPKYDTLVVRPSNPTDAWAGFEGLPMKWGIFSHHDKKSGKPITPNNARDDKIEGHPWRFHYSVRIPPHRGHEFHGMVGAHSTGWWAGIPRHRGRPSIDGVRRARPTV